MAAFSSELEKTNLEVHVDMSLHRYSILEEKVETLDERMDAMIHELSDFRKENTKNISDLKDAHVNSISLLREENAMNAQSTNKLFVGAAATVIGGLLSTIVVLLVAFM